MEFFAHYFIIGLFVVLCLSYLGVHRRLPFWLQMVSVFFIVMTFAEIKTRRVNTTNVQEVFEQGKTVRCPVTFAGTEHILLNKEEGWILKDSRHFRKDEREIYLNSNHCDVMEETRTDKFYIFGIIVFGVIELFMMFLYMALKGPKVIEILENNIEGGQDANQ